MTMVAGVLPDFDQRHRLQFHLWPRMEYRRRLVLAGALILIGLAVQFFWTAMDWPTMLMWSIPWILLGNALLLVHGYDLRPSRQASRGEWEKTTLDRFRAARRLENDAQSWDQTFIDVTCVAGCFSLVCLVGLTVLMILVLNSSVATRFWAPVLPADIAALVLPHWLTGLRIAWRPVSLSQQIDAIENALGVVERYREPPCQIQPMFEMTGTEAKRVPIRARVLVRFPDGPKDFLGLQFQVAINNVQGARYPYLYAVLIARKAFGINERSKTMIDGGVTRGLIVEEKSETDVDVIVIRQKTTKTTGYHTEPTAIRKIAEYAWQTASALVR